METFDINRIYAGESDAAALEGAIGDDGPGVAIANRECIEGLLEQRASEGYEATLSKSWGYDDDGGLSAVFTVAQDRYGMLRVYAATDFDTRDSIARAVNMGMGMGPAPLVCIAFEHWADRAEREHRERMLDAA